MGRAPYYQSFYVVNCGEIGYRKEKNSVNTMNTRRDWAAIAKAYGIEATGRDLDRVVDGLRAVDDVFRPLVAALPLALMAAGSFRAIPEGDE